MFNLGPGKMEIKINKATFQQGETIEGEIRLTVNKPIKARALRIRLVGTRRRISSSGRTTTQIVSDIPFDIVGEQEFQPSSEPQVFPFKLQIPNNVVKNDFGEGTIGNVLKAIQGIGNALNPIHWTLKGSLDIPMSFDITKDVKINITA